MFNLKEKAKKVIQALTSNKYDTATGTAVLGTIIVC